MGSGQTKVIVTANYNSDGVVNFIANKEDFLLIKMICNKNFEISEYEQVSSKRSYKSEVLKYCEIKLQSSIDYNQSINHAISFNSEASFYQHLENLMV